MSKAKKPDHVWAEELPANCPPEEAEPPQNEEFFRLTSDPVRDNDFDSQRRLHPNRFFGSKDECIVRATSLWRSQSDCAKLKKRSPHKNKAVTKLTLPPSSGVVFGTFREGHYSWWRAAGFNPLDVCTIVG